MSQSVCVKCGRIRGEYDLPFAPCVSDPTNYCVFPAPELKPGEAGEGTPRQWRNLAGKILDYCDMNDDYDTYGIAAIIAEHFDHDLPHSVPPPDNGSLRGVIYQTVRNWIDNGHSYLNERIQQGDMGNLSEHIARAVARSVPQEWQSIASAPKEAEWTSGRHQHGPLILAYPVGHRVDTVYWWQTTDGKASNFLDGGGNAVHPTRWMPLPDAPKGD